METFLRFQESQAWEMRPELFHSIRWRLIASYVLITFLSVSIVGVLAAEIMQRYIREQEVRELQANAESIAEQLGPLMWPHTYLAEIHSLTQAASFLGDMRVRVLDNNGFTLVDSGMPGTLEELLIVFPPERPGRNTLQDEALFNLIMPDWETPRVFYDNDAQISRYQFAGTSFQFIQRATGPWGGRITFRVPHAEVDSQEFTEENTINRSINSVREPIGSQKEPLGFVEVSAGQDLSAATLATLQRAFLLAGGGAVLAAVILGLWMSQRLTSPLRSLQKTAGKMAAGDLSARSIYQRRDEIGNLSNQFNLMADQLQENFTQMQAERDTLRRFISDASHELRTPVTALKNFLTLLQSAAAKDKEVQSEFFAESQVQVEQLEWITNNLLNLTRLDSGLEEINFDNHDLGTLIHRSAAPFISQAEANHISLELQEPDPQFSLWCDISRMELVVSNLLDNALKFTPKGGEIVIGGEQVQGSKMLWVRDNGIGITPDELPRIFDRFYRGRQPAKEGSGLGLAIAKSLVEAQNGHITVESTPGKGSKFIITFPVID
jgi:signal transduction histidine kinase